MLALYDSTKNTNTPLIPGRHHRLLDTHLRDVAAGKCPLLILQLPVQHGKTTYATQYNIAWYLGNWPDKSVVGISYTGPVADDKIGRPTRNILNRCGPDVFGVKVDRSSNSVSRWDLEGHQFNFFCTGVGSGIAARRIDLGVIDDPIGSRADVDSRMKRDDMWDWFQKEYSPRLHPQSATIVVMSRWNEDDLTGRLIRFAIAQGLLFRVVDLPAICPPPDEEGPVAIAMRSIARSENRPEPPLMPYVDELGRSEGEALWPEVRDRAFLDRQRILVGGQQFDAQFQGRPRAAAGATFKRIHFQRYRSTKAGMVLLDKNGAVVDTWATHEIKVFQTVDVALGESAKGDFFVIATLGMTPKFQTLILHIDRPTPCPQAPEQLELLNLAVLKWRPFAQGIEAVAYQNALVQFAVRRGLPAKPIVRGKGQSKEARADLAAVRYEQGTVFHPEAAPWLETLEDEMLQFPRGAYDDQVDAVVDGVNIVAEAGAQANAAASYAAPTERQRR